MSEPEANKRGSSLIGKRSHCTGLEHVFAKRKDFLIAVRSKAQGIVVYARMKKLTCTVFHVLSRVEDCSEVRFSQLCKLLCFFFACCWGFYTCDPLLLCSE